MRSEFSINNLDNNDMKAKLQITKKLAIEFGIEKDKSGFYFVSKSNKDYEMIKQLLKFEV